MILDRCRDKEEFKKLFNDRPMNDGIMDFDFILNNPYSYYFYGEDDNNLKGYISIYTDETKRLFLCGASIRKNMADNIQAIITVCKAFNDDIYSDTDKKEAKICLLKAGFQKLNNTLFVRYKNGKRQ